MSTTNYSDPRSYPMLARLLDRPDTLDFTDRPTLHATLRRAVDASLLLPPGAPREDLLRTLNSAVCDACHRRDYYRDKQILTEQLRASAPCAAEVRDTAHAIRSATCAMQLAVQQAEVRLPAEAKARGSTWSVFVHELCRLTAIINHRTRILEKTEGITVTPEYVPEIEDTLCRDRK